MSWTTALLVVNLALQVWDGLATYGGLSHGVQEGNLLVQSCMADYGVGVTLVGAKAAACLFLTYLSHTVSLAVSQWGLMLTAISYVLFSFIP